MPNDETSRTDELDDPEEGAGSRSDSSAADPGRSARPATRWWVALWSVFTGGLVLAGVPTLMAAYETRISIEKLDPLDPKDPFVHGIRD